jgi:hypothetical protein
LLGIIDTSRYNIKKEATFFLSTLILFSADTELPRFAVAPVIDVLVAMVGCGVEKVVLRCLDTIGKLVRCTGSAAEAVKALAESDLMERLGELLDDPEQPLVTERGGADIPGPFG